MVVALLCAGALLVVLPGAIRGTGRRLHPREWTRLVTVALATGMLLVEAAAILLAGPTVLRSVGVHDWALACEHLLGPLVPGWAVAGWLGAAAAVLLPAVAATTLWRAHRCVLQCRAEPFVGQHRSYGGYELVLLPTSEPLAIAVGGGGSAQILLSEGLATMLPADELDAVLRHEAAHLAHRHHRFLLVATAVERLFGRLPGIRRSAHTLRVAVERWADEVAAGDDRHQREAVRDALWDVTVAALASPVAAFSAADTVQERLDALNSPPSRPSYLWHIAAYAPVGAVAAILLVIFSIWARDAAAIIGLGTHCPT